MTITLMPELKEYSKYSQCKPRQCFIIEHNGYKVEYLPVNGDLTRFRCSVRNCILRTLKGKYYKEIWA